MDRLVTGRRSLIAALGAVSADACLAKRSAAQLGRAGRAIVGFPPGGTADIVTRMYVEQPRASMGGQTIVDDRPGAGGRLALETPKPLPADGAAFVVTPASMLAIYPHLYAKTLRHDPAADSTAVAPACVFPFGSAVSAPPVAEAPARRPRRGDPVLRGLMRRLFRKPQGARSRL